MNHGTGNLLWWDVLRLSLYRAEGWREGEVSIGGT